MHVITHARVVAAQARFPESSRALDFWYRAMKRGRFATFVELRATFGSVDKVGTLFVFNIGGNKYRLMTRIRYDYQLINIRAVLTHAEYDRGRWKE